MTSNHDSSITTSDHNGRNCRQAFIVAMAERVEGGPIEGGYAEIVERYHPIRHWPFRTLCRYIELAEDDRDILAALRVLAGRIREIKRKLDYD